VKKITTAVAALLILGALTACEGKSTAQTKGQEQTERAFSQQSKAVPYPVADLKDSLERRNVRERLLRTNDPTKIGYVYLLNFGKVFGYYTVKGKVSSTQSQMTTDQLIARPCGSCDRYVVNAPGDDGSYGANEDGIFFFTTEGAYVTTNLDYLYADQPLPFDVPELGAKP